MTHRAYWDSPFVTQDTNGNSKTVGLFLRVIQLVKDGDFQCCLLTFELELLSIKLVCFVFLKKELVEIEFMCSTP